MGRSDYLECAKVVSTHGVAGAIKLKSWCDSPYVLKKLPKLYLKDGDAYSGRKVEKASVFKDFVIAKLEGIDTLERASELKNRILFAARDDFRLDDGAYFIADIIGLDVMDADDGRVYGTLSDVTNYGASDIYTVETASGERMIPAVPEFVVRVDPDKGVFVRPIEGMFDL